jgi:hypothetical protein
MATQASTSTAIYIQLAVGGSACARKKMSESTKSASSRVGGWDNMIIFLFPYLALDPGQCVGHLRRLIPSEDWSLFPGNAPKTRPVK